MIVPNGPHPVEWSSGWSDCDCEDDYPCNLTDDDGADGHAWECDERCDCTCGRAAG